VGSRVLRPKRAPRSRVPLGNGRQRVRCPIQERRR
jgi:hypothetical protein